MVPVNVCAPGYWDMFDSYGLIACQLSRQLTRLGYYVNAYALGGVEFGNQPDDIQAMIARPRVPSFGTILMGYPTSYYRHGSITAGHPRIALTMFESSRIPGGWRDVLNRCDLVVTPSVFCRDIFIDGGVTTPIRVEKLGVSRVYAPIDRHENRPLTFLAFLDRGARKGGLLALWAFVSAFRERRDVRLILKSRHHAYPLEILNENVTVVDDDMTEQELYELFREADVLIAPTTGEGFGLIPREFAATGGVALATNWSGTADDIGLWGVPLEYDLVPAQWTSEKLVGQDLGVWAKVGLDHLVDRLRDVVDNWPTYRDRARENAREVYELYTWERFAVAMSESWQEISHDYSSRSLAIAS